MAGRVGIEYNYQLWLDYGMVSKEHGYKLKPGDSNYIFEIRTNFIFKKTKIDEEHEGEDEFLDSEKLGFCFSYNNNAALPLLSFICFRLEEYWMTDEEMDQLESDAVGFARRQMALARSQPSDDDDDLDDIVIPTVVEIDVCTEQQEWETAGEARARAIRSKHLIPVYLWQPPFFKLDQLTTRPRPPRLMSFLRQLPRIRVVDDADDDCEGNLVNFGCSICSKSLWFGVQKTSLPCCGHTFHSHCVVRWLERDHLCPSCATPAYDPAYMHLF